MSNTPIQVTTDLSKVLEQINTKLDKIDEKFEAKFDKIEERLNKLEIGQVKLEGDIGTLKDDVKDIKGTQKAQIWTLITTIIAALLGILVALGRFIFLSGKP